VSSPRGRTGFRSPQALPKRTISPSIGLQRTHEIHTLKDAIEQPGRDARRYPAAGRGVLVSPDRSGATSRRSRARASTRSSHLNRRSRSHDRRPCSLESRCAPDATPQTGTRESSGIADTLVAASTPTATVTRLWSEPVFSAYPSTTGMRRCVAPRFPSGHDRSAFGARPPLTSSGRMVARLRRPGDEIRQSHCYGAHHVAALELPRDLHSYVFDPLLRHKVRDRGRRRPAGRSMTDGVRVRLGWIGACTVTRANRRSAAADHTPSARAWRERGRGPSRPGPAE
jgi:hypothetical protein